MLSRLGQAAVKRQCSLSFNSHVGNMPLSGQLSPIFGRINHIEMLYSAPI